LRFVLVVRAGKQPLFVRSLRALVTRPTYRARFAAASQWEKRVYSSLRSDQLARWPRSTSTVTATSLTPADSSSLAVTGTTAFIELAPCDVVMADVQAQTPDERVIALLEICRGLEDGLI
jgi:hypothetical protein